MAMVRTSTRDAFAELLADVATHGGDKYFGEHDIEVGFLTPPQQPAETHDASLCLAVRSNDSKRSAKPLVAMWVPKTSLLSPVLKRTPV